MNYIPKTVDEFIEKCFEWLGEEECKKALTKLGKEFDVSELHFSLGMDIRNKFLLWTEESAELKKDVWNKIDKQKQKFYIDYWSQYNEKHVGSQMHPDDCSYELLNFLWQEIVKRYGDNE